MQHSLVGLAVSASQQKWRSREERHSARLDPEPALDGKKELKRCSELSSIEK
jgi:hypothetical protein